MKTKFRNFLKSIGLIKKDKIEELEKLATEIKYLAERDNNDEGRDNPNYMINCVLFDHMYHTLQTIKRIKENNPKYFLK